MRVLFITGNRDVGKIRDEFRLHNICESENFLHFPNFEKTKDFIANSLLKESAHIDIIIIDENIKNNHFSEHIVDWIRHSFFEYSTFNFKLASIPIILYGEEIKSVFERDKSYGYSRIVTKFANDFAHRNLIKNITPEVKKFRSSIKDDLDDLNIDFNEIQTNIIYTPAPYYIFDIKPYSNLISQKLQVLSQTFVANPKKLNYDWLSASLIDFERALEKYEEIIRRKKFNRTNSEKNVFHKFFNDNKWALIRDVYKEQLYEKPLMKNKLNYEEPDYILSSPMPKHIPTTIFEVKLSNIEILAKRNRKPKFLDKFEDGLIQTSDYYRHLKFEKHKKEMGTDILGYKPGAITFKLLASNDKAMQRNEKRIRELLKDHYLMLEFLTHDDLLSLMINYYQRLTIYSL